MTRIIDLELQIKSCTGDTDQGVIPIKFREPSPFSWSYVYEATWAKFPRWNTVEHPYLKGMVRKTCQQSKGQRSKRTIRRVWCHGSQEKRVYVVNSVTFYRKWKSIHRIFVWVVLVEWWDRSQVWWVKEWVGCGKVEFRNAQSARRKTEQVRGSQILRTGAAYISSLGGWRQRAEGKRNGMNVPALYKALRKGGVAFLHPVLRALVVVGPGASLLSDLAIPSLKTVYQCSILRGQF